MHIKGRKHHQVTTGVYLLPAACCLLIACSLLIALCCRSVSLSGNGGGGGMHTCICEDSQDSTVECTCGMPDYRRGVPRNHPMRVLTERMHQVRLLLVSPHLLLAACGRVLLVICYMYLSFATCGL